MNELAKSYDFIVVGGGTAGCVVASHLSDDRSNRVLMVEAGGPDTSPWLKIPAASFKVSADPQLAWGFFTEPQAALNGRRMPVIQAKILGGGSSINGMVYTRGFASTFNAWRDMGCDGWGYEDVLPYFRKAQASDRGAGPFHGGAGFMKTVQATSDLPITDHILAAFGEIGIPRIDDLNVPNPDGVGYYDWAVADGRRASMPVVLPGFRNDRSNLTVATGVTVTRVLAERDRIVGVELIHQGQVTTIRAEREVVLCAGAVSSPKLLLQSGIGPADELRALGIAVVADHPHVGKNLQNHVAYRQEFLCAEPITARKYIHPVHGPIETFRYLFGRKGFLAGASSPAGGFFRSNDNMAEPDIQVFAIPAVMGVQPTLLGRLPKVHGYTFCINQGTPYSRGTVTLRSADPLAAPVIAPNYLADPRDMEAMARGAARIRELAAAPSLAKYTTRELSPGPEVRTHADWARHISANAFNHFHVAGTCRIGRSVADSVTDSKLKVHGVTGLRVADGGVMPLLMNGNTNASVMMIAERAAEMILASA